MGKHTKSSSSGGAADDVVKQEPELQAVLLADSFTRTFRPISLDRSKMLCPLNNVCMLDYSLEFLAGAGVQEVVVVCTSDDVEIHLSKVKITGEMKVTCVKDGSLTNAGDALREIDKRNLIASNPFLLMYGDVVTNVDLSLLIEQHKRRHKQDTSAIMTILFQRVAPQSKLRPPGSDLLVGLDPSTQRLLVFDDHASKPSTGVPCSFFTSSASTIELHDDLLDCGLDICSPQVLARFSDEFDYRDVRREFVTNTVAEEEEALQQKLFGHILSCGHYAARVHDFASYHTISRDLLQRWCYPVVPDNLPNGYETKYRYALQRHYLYKEQRHPARIGFSSRITGPGMVGRIGEVGKNCQITGTLIGDDCRIGDNVTLRGAHVWSKVTVEEGATVVQSILADGVVIKKGATVSRGCIVGSGCVIGNGVILSEFTRITKTLDTDCDGGFGDDDFGAFSSSEDDDDDENSAEAEGQPQDTVHSSDHDVVGPDGVGRVWRPTDLLEDDEGEEKQLDPLELLKAQSIGYDRSLLYKRRDALEQDADDDFSYSEAVDGGALVGADFSKDFEQAITFSGEDAAPPMAIQGRSSGVDVVKELKDICLEHYGPFENLAIELSSFKFSQNATYSDCTMAATLAMIEKMDIQPDMSAGKLVASLKSQLEQWAALLKKMSIGLEEERSIVVALEMAATAAAQGQEVTSSVLNKEPAFRFLLQTLHDEEVVSEEAILSWAAERRDEPEDTPRGQLFRQQPTQDFLEWLEEEESEGEDSEEAEEEDSD